MKEQDKYVLQKGLFKSIQLKTIISKYISTINVPSFLVSQRLKSLPVNLKKLSPDFLQKILFYLFQKRFEWTISDFNQSNLLQGNQLLKEYYLEYTFQALSKKQNSFEYILIYLTKLTCGFIDRYFHDISIDMILESEIYITLMFVTVGYEVSHKSYAVTLKKYTNKCISTKKLNIKNESCDKYSSKMSINKVQEILDRKSQKKIKDTDRSSMYLKENEHDTIENFKDHLKKHLTVQVFPRLIKKKINVHQYDFANMKDPSLSKQNIQSGQKGFLNSTQVTSSMQFMVVKNNLPPKYVGHNVKIMHRLKKHIGNFTRHTRCSSKNKEDFMDSRNQDRREEYNVAKKDWKKVVLKIKSANLDIKNLFHTHTGKFNRQRDDRQRYTQHYKTQSIDDIQVDEYTNQKSDKAMHWLQNSKNADNLISYSIEGTAPVQKQKHTPKNQLASHLLKYQKLSFASECEKRNKKINYSLFAIEP